LDKKQVKGSCLCGDVSYQYSGDAMVFQYCHCSRCRKFTGSAHASNIIISPEQFQWITSEEMVGRYELPETKHFATSFCKKCGSSLPWKTQSGKAVIIPAGTLDDDPDIKPTHNIFYTNKAPWYEEVGCLNKFEAFPVKD